MMYIINEAPNILFPHALLIKQHVPLLIQRGTNYSVLAGVSIHSESKYKLKEPLPLG